MKMTDKQYKYLQDLIKNFDFENYRRMELIDEFTARKIVERCKKEAENRETSKKRASELIDMFKKYQKRLTRNYEVKYIRAKYDGFDAETGEPFKAGELIFYSDVHGGYCRADNY